MFPLLLLQKREGSMLMLPIRPLFCSFQLLGIVLPLVIFAVFATISRSAHDLHQAVLGTRYLCCTFKCLLCHEAVLGTHPPTRVVRTVSLLTLSPKFVS